MVFEINVGETDTLGDVVLQMIPSLKGEDAKSGLHTLGRDLESSTSGEEALKIAKYLVAQQVRDIQALGETYKTSIDRHLLCMDILEKAGIDDFAQAA